ncbi:hypothetical protein ACFVW1_50090 [Streptomyces olivochromogenes]|uniref:hypothetical protein n=1 Tax=Streptomyces olivochromogenes TaxID=1963 RepID=UPI0036DD470A
MPVAGRLKDAAGLLLALFCLGALCAGPAQAADGPATGSLTGAITIAVGWDRSRQEVVISETWRFMVAPHSKALAQLRAYPSSDAVWTSYTLEANGKAGATVAHDGVYSHLNKVTQASPGEAARVETHYEVHLTRRSGEQNLTLSLNPYAPYKATAGFPRAWTVTVSAPRWSFLNVRGAVESQTPSTVVWRVATGSAPSKGRPVVTPSVSLQRTVKTTKPPLLRHQTQREMISALSLAVGGIGVVAACLVASLAGAAARWRWKMATLVLAVAVCPLAVLGTPVTDHDDFFFGADVVPNYNPPDTVWTPGPALGLWLWYVLPIAGWWFSDRLATRRPPSACLLWACGASAALPFVLMAAGGRWPTVREGSVLEVSLGAALGLGVLLYTRKSSVARRWAATAGTLVWIVPLALLLSRFPIMAGAGPNIPRTHWFDEAAVLVLSWPAAAWLTSLLGPVLRRSLRPETQLICFLLLWGTLTAPFLIAWSVSFNEAPGEPYRTAFFTGYTGFPLCVMAVCGVILQIAYLYRRGAIDGGGRAVEPVGRVLLVCGVTLALGSPSLRTLTMWGDALGILWAALGTLVLIPPGSARTAAKFRRVSRKAHAGFMDRWVRTQLLWDTRADFQRTARSSLTDDMEVSDFLDRWRQLDVPGRRGDPATRLARAKRFALGSSAGVAPRVAGSAGAALAQLLALPWAGYKLVTGSAVGADSAMPFHLTEISQALRFAHWALYGFVFGYFYVLLRGLTPIGKAGSLALVVLPAEILPMVTLTVDPQYTQSPSWTDLAVACGGLAGQTFVVCMGLGLCWEWWLARAAAMKWSQVRNFRRLSSITIPAGTVLVAAATAFATVVAGTWAQQELVPPSSSAATDQSSQSAP